MAIRERLGRIKPFQVYWNNPFTGKRETESFATRLEAEEKDSLIKHRLKFDRESFRPEEKENQREITLEQAFLAYWREKQFTTANLQRQLYAVKPALEKWGTSPVSQIDYADVMAILSQPRKKHSLKASTIFRVMCIIRAVLRWNAEAGLCEMPKLPRLPHGKHEQLMPPTRDELEKMLQVALPHIQRVIIFGAHLGCRIGPCELFKMTWNDIDLVSCIARVPGTLKNKQSPWREVPIKESLLPTLAAWAIVDKEKDIIHIINYAGKPVTRILGAWKATLHKAGITRRIRPYDLRHCFATELIAAGADIGTVAKLMGHTDTKMVLSHYQYVMDTQKRAAIERLPDLPYVPKSCARLFDKL